MDITEMEGVFPASPHGGEVLRLTAPSQLITVPVSVHGAFMEQAGASLSS